MGSPMRIAYFGLPLAGVLLARDGHRIEYAAACRKAPGLRRLTRLLGVGRVHIRPDVASSETLRRVELAAPDLIVSWFWTTRLTPSLLRLAPALGVHPSLLPRHRGPDPYFWTIDSGDESTGVTAHLLDADYDTGPVLSRRALPIEPTWNAWQLARALDRPSLELLRQVVRAYADGHPPAAVAQDEREATAAPAPEDDDLSIQWSWSASRIERRVRAAAPTPGAWTEIGDRVVTLLRVRATPDYPRTLEPAEAAVRSDGVAVVRTADAAVELLEGRLDDDEVGALADEPAQVVGVEHFARLVAEARGKGG